MYPRDNFRNKETISFQVKSHKDEENLDSNEIPKISITVLQQRLIRSAQNCVCSVLHVLRLEPSY